MDPLLQQKLNDLLNVTVINADLDKIVGIIHNHRLGITRSAWVVAKYCYIVRENKLLFGLGAHWASGLSRRTGYSQIVIRRYSNVFEIFLKSVPDGLRVEILALGVGRLIPLVPLYNKDLLTSENWKRFIANPNHIPRLAKEITGGTYRSSTAHIQINKQGELYAVSGDEKYIKLGNIDLSLINKNAIAKTAILRIIKNSNISVV